MSKDIAKKSDDLIDLLTEQCADLENLLSLAREETDAAKQGNFSRIIDIYQERSELGERLETFQQQITDLRETLDRRVPANISDKISTVVSQTLAQDTKTRKLLTAANEDTAQELAQLAKARINTKHYSNERKKGLALELEA
ncbi:MAG: hypothetical protein HKN33_01135 [Pyrinomonadaceae bacterium]|nr:hypothetical protein [Pyrinomonadaceae bacterium]